MKKFFGKKIVIIAVVSTLLISVAVFWFVLRPSSKPSAQQGPTITKVDSVFGYIGAESTYSKFNSLVGMFDSAKYLVKNEAGLEPSLLVFAPNNDAFAKDEMKPFESLPLTARDQIKLYHIAVVYPDAQGQSADLNLTDGKKIKTLLGRELLVSKKDDSITITDGKGREITVSNNYAVSSKGDRVYYLDKVLLFQ